MDIQLIILDFDGTLGDSQHLIVSTMLAVIDELHLDKRTPEQCAAMIGLPLKETFTRLIPMTDAMGDRCAETYGRIFHERNVPGAVKPFPHVLETLAALHAKGITLTIASSRHRQSLLRFVDEMGLSETIRFVLGANDVTDHKPAPEAVLRTLEHFKVAPDNALVVGDAPYDILMGNAAGTRTCAVTYGNGTRAELEAARPDFVIDDFAQLLDLVKQGD